MKKRAKHNLSHYRMVTGAMGEIMPISCVPVLPGDSFQASTSVMVRVTPLNTPVMHPVEIRTHSFFVPTRTIWPESENGGWEQFITGGPDGLNSASPPTITITNGNKKDVTAYLGVPPPENVGLEINALPLRGFNAIINEYYRDQDIGAVRDQHDNTLPLCAWGKDYFTTARVSSQKGPQVTLPVGDKAPLMYESVGSGVPSALITEGSGGNLQDMLTSNPSLEARPGTGPVANGQQMFADLASATGITVNDLRAMTSLQRYQEARSRFGSRFTEYLRYLGIRPSDARLQRPEFLGGGSARLNFSEVLQTTPATQEGTAGVGDLYGHGIAGVRSNRYRKFFEEHGFVYTLLSVRPKAIYMNGVHREFFKKTKEDYFQKELANLGQQEVLKGELFADTGSRLQTFGFQDRYDEYRQHWSWVSQDFRDTLSSWHLARILDTNVALNPSFIDCKPSDRIYQVGGNVDPLWIMANNRIVARRLVPRRANPRII